MLELQGLYRLEVFLAGLVVKVVLGERLEVNLLIKVVHDLVLVNDNVLLFGHLETVLDIHCSHLQALGVQALNELGLAEVETLEVLSGEGLLVLNLVDLLADELDYVL